MPVALLRSRAPTQLRAPTRQVGELPREVAPRQGCDVGIVAKARALVHGTGALLREVVGEKFAVLRRRSTGGEAIVGRVGDERRAANLPGVKAPPLADVGTLSVHECSVHAVGHAPPRVVDEQL
eukprot:4681755-Prymnesium_polylepis.2